MGIFSKSNRRYDICYRDELSNGALIFLIESNKLDDFRLAGHVIVSPNGEIAIEESSSCNLDEDNRNYLKEQAKKFYDASR